MHMTDAEKAERIDAEYHALKNAFLQSYLEGYHADEGAQGAMGASLGLARMREQTRLLLNEAQELLRRLPEEQQYGRIVAMLGRLWRRRRRAAEQATPAAETQEE